MSDRPSGTGDSAAPAALSRGIEIEVISLFPEILDSFLAGSLLGKAIVRGLVVVHRTNPRDFAPGAHRQVDDAPYGGGAGMVLQAPPLIGAIEHVEAARGRAWRVLLSPVGRPFDQGAARDLASRGRVALLCGRYEGVDERVASGFMDDVVSIGDYVLAGGEVAAMVLIESMTRLVPGVVGSEESTVHESFVTGRLEHPHYTRPPVVRGERVPEVLLSGNHAAVARWRQRESLLRTRARRPDLLDKVPLTAEERLVVDETDDPGPI